MIGITKAGWFLMGLGIGIFGTTILVKHELDKPLGELEPYIPLEDREDGEYFEDSADDSIDDYKNGRDRSESDQDDKKDISSRSADRRIEFRSRQSSGHNHREEEHAEFSSNQDEVLNYYRSSDGYDSREESKSISDKRKAEFRERRREVPGNQTKRYSRMYQDQAIKQALHSANSHRASKDSYELDETSYSDDSPSDDDYAVVPVYDSDLHDEYTLERVEENIEIFLDDNPQDFITLIFYEGDNTLCDDGEQIIPNADEVVGLVALSRLIEGGPGAENGVIFVHNLKTSLNYEVVLDAGSYQDTVIGQFESHLNNGGDWSGSS